MTSRDTDKAVQLASSSILHSQDKALEVFGDIGV